MTQASVVNRRRDRAILGRSNWCYCLSFSINSTNLSRPLTLLYGARNIKIRRGNAKIRKSGHPELNRGPKRLARRFSPKGYLEPKWLRWIGILLDRVRQSYMLLHGRKKITWRSNSRKRKKAPPQQRLRRRLKFRFRKGEQIVGTQEKSQQIVAQRLLSCLQYLDSN